MPGRARLDAPGTLHHVIVRGIEKCKLVDDDQDRSEVYRKAGGAVNQDASCHICLGADEQPRPSALTKRTA